MGLTETAEKNSVPPGPTVLESLHRIGEVAYLGLRPRSDFLQRHPAQSRHRGEALSVLRPGGGTHQEGSTGRHNPCVVFLALQDSRIRGCWLSKESWRDQCLSNRYITNSVDNFSIFRMVTHFLCGLLSTDADASATQVQRCPMV